MKCAGCLTGSWIALCLLAAAAGAAEGNLLFNGDFAARTEAGAPAKWNLGKGQKISVDADPKLADVKQALRVDITEDGGSSYGQVYQGIKPKPNTLYVLEGRTKSTKAALAFFSIKLIKDKKELKRVGLAKSQAEWSVSSLEFSSEEADEIQVLCRWEQSAKKGAVGQTCWFADVKLTEKGAAPPPAPHSVAIKQAAGITPVEAPPLPLKAAAGDLFVTPAGAGKRDGSSWENALPGNAPGVIQAAWDAIAPGQSCRIGSGVYIDVSLKINTGGTAADKLKRLVGEDTGQGLPWFVGTWQPSAPDKGPTFLSLVDEVDFCAFENVQVARYQYAVFSRKGRHVGLRFRNLDAYENRHGMYLCGQAYADEADQASHDMVIESCEFIHFTKSAIRLQGGNYDVRIINCVADAGGADWMKEAFQICYMVSGDHPRKLGKKDDKPWASEHDIIFINCIARNAIWSKARYWQGDGFLCEGDMRNIAYINCLSHDNADGGWDAKAQNVIYVNCMGLRNKMNFRVWNHGYFHNSLSANALKRGGSWTSSGLWTVGDTRAIRSTFHNNDYRNFAADSKKYGDDPNVPAKVGKIALERCIVSFDGQTSKTELLYAGEAQVTKTDTAEWAPKTEKTPAVGEDPQYVAATEGKTWTGKPADAFDSKRYGTDKGFHSSVSSLWRSKSPEQLVEAARTLLKHTGWDDFKQKIERLEKTPAPSN